VAAHTGELNVPTAVRTTIQIVVHIIINFGFFKSLPCVPGMPRLSRSFSFLGLSRFLFFGFGLTVSDEGGSPSPDRDPPISDGVVNVPTDKTPKSFSSRSLRDNRVTREERAFLV